MESARWERVQELFHGALDLDEPERGAFLASACGQDSALMRDVTAMLEADAKGGSLLDRGLKDIADRLVGSAAETVTQQEFGPYRLLKILGEGGMGVVWLAERADTASLVAIKFLPHAGLTPARRERFAREVRTLAKLNHPYIARLYDAGTLEDGTPWFVMEYVEGVRLTEYCRAPGRTLEEQLKIFRAVCEAVQYAHGQEIIHRDLKPSNILITAEGEPRLLDFGIARELHQLEDSGEQTRPGLRFLSREYAAPEWAREGIVGLYTDVYSLGVILYEMLAGRLPVDKWKAPGDAGNEGLPGQSVERPSIAAGRLTGEGQDRAQAQRLAKGAWGAWSDLDLLCLKAMHPDRKERYQSVEALLRDVNHFLNSEPLEARPDSLLYRADKFVRRNRTAVLATALALVLIAGISAVFTVRLIESRAVALAEAARTQRIQQFMLNLFQGGDKDAGPSEDLRVVTLIDRGVDGAQSLNNEPEVQADLYQTLGKMYQRLGRLDRADELMQRSMQVRSAVPKLDRVAEADDLIALGLLRSEQGKAKEAERLVRQALADIQSHDKGNKARIAAAQAALGSVLVTGGQQANSVAVLNEAIANLNASGKDASPELAQAVGTLADAQLYLGHYDEAVALYQRALAIDTRVYGERHPHIGDDLANLGEIQELRGNYDEAERYERQALQIVQGWYGADHPETARRMATLAGTLGYKGNYPEAEELLENALRIQKKAYGNEHTSVAYVVNALGMIALQQKKFRPAEDDFRETIDIYRAAFGDADYRVAVAIGNLASVYQAEKRFPECERMLLDAVDRFTKALGPNNINTGMAEVRLGRTMLHEEKYKEAEKHSRAGYEALKGQTSANTSYFQAALKDLGLEYTALNQPAEAERFKSEAESSAVPAAKAAGAK